MTTLDQVESGISEIQSMSVRIQALGGSVDKATIESAILRASPKPFLMSWTFLDEEKRTLDNLHAHLMRQISLLRSEESTSKALAAKPNFRSKGKGQPKSQSSDSSKDKKFCRYCKKVGHLIQDCRKLVKKKAKEEEKSPSSESKPKEEEKQAGILNEPGPQLMISTIVDQEPVYEALHSASSNNAVSSYWIADTGASFHMTCQLNWIVYYTEFSKAIQIKLGNDEIVEAYGSGYVQTHLGLLTPVYFVPDIKENLFSVTASARNHQVYALSKDKEIVLFKNDQEIMRGIMTTSGVYQLNLIITIPQYTAGSASSLTDWHEVLGHVSQEKIKFMFDHNVVDDLRLNKKEDQIKCESCARSKTSRSPHQSRTTPKCKSAGQVLHMDTVTAGEPSLSDSKYFVLIKCEYSSYRMVLFVQTKDQIPILIKRLINVIKAEVGYDVLKSLIKVQNSRIILLNLSSIKKELHIACQMSIRTKWADRKG